MSLRARRSRRVACRGSPSQWCTTTGWSTSKASAFARPAAGPCRCRHGLPARIHVETSFLHCRCRLVSEGSVDWDSRISDLDPGFQLHDPYPTAEVTVRDLLTIAAACPAAPETTWRISDSAGRRSCGGCAWYRRLRASAPVIPTAMPASPRARSRRRNDRQELGVVAEEKLYRPLGMASTSSRYVDFLARTNRAALHVKAAGVWTAKVKRDPDMQSPAGGAAQASAIWRNGCGWSLAMAFLTARTHRAGCDRPTHAPLTARGITRSPAGVLLRPGLECRVRSAMA